MTPRRQLCLLHVLTGPQPLELSHGCAYSWLRWAQSEIYCSCQPILRSKSAAGAAFNEVRCDSTPMSGGLQLTTEALQ